MVRAATCQLVHTQHIRRSNHESNIFVRREFIVESAHGQVRSRVVHKQAYDQDGRSSDADRNVEQSTDRVQCHVHVDVDRVAFEWRGSVHASSNRSIFQFALAFVTKSLRCVSAQRHDVRVRLGARLHAFAKRVYGQLSAGHASSHASRLSASSLLSNRTDQIDFDISVRLLFGSHVRLDLRKCG